MTYRIVFELPGLPRTTNGSHGHWRAAAAERKKWRDAVAMIARFRRPEAPLKKANITLTRFSSVRPDFDNLAISFKSVVDGLRDAGVIVDDKDSVLIERKYLWEKAPQGKGSISIEVEEAVIGSSKSGKAL